jgi:hypothetical protein
MAVREQPTIAHGPACSPGGAQINMVPEYPAMLKGMGLIDSAQQKVFESYCARITTAIKAKFFSTAFAIWDEMINGDLFPYNRCVPCR